MVLIMHIIFVFVFITCVAFDTPKITVAKTPAQSPASHWAFWEKTGPITAFTS